MADPKFYLHVGFSKTATTSLQDHVFVALPGFQCLGKPWGDVGYTDQGLRRALSHLCYEDSIRYDSDFVRCELDRVVDIDGGKILISSEGLTYGRLGDSRYYYNPVMVARRLKHIFKEDTTIIFTIREQMSWLCSLYLDDSSRRIFFDPGTTIKRWFATEQREQKRGHVNALDMANFDAIIREYETVFGSRDIRVLVFEELTEDVEAFTRNLCNALEFSDIDWMRNRLTTMNRHKRRLSKRAYFFGLVNRYFVPEIFRGVYHILNPGLERFLRRGSPVDVATPESHQKLLDGRYSAGNRRLNDVYDLDLARYGYML